MSDEMKVWFNGQLRDFAECTVSVRTHALHYGTSVFEGIRSYQTPDGARVFRLTDHLKRLYWSAAVYRMPVPYDMDELHQACRDTIKENGLGAAYLRPIVFRGDCGLGVLPRDLSICETAIIANEWGTYLGEGVLEKGVEVCISSWQRVAPNTIPAGAKAGGNYLSSLSDRVRGAGTGLYRGHSTGRRRPGERGLGREHFRGQWRAHSHAAGFGIDTRRYYP